MIELPEARTIARDLRKEIVGKRIVEVGGNYTDHKFTFYSGDPDEYDGLLSGKQVTALVDRNYYVEIEIEDFILVFRDGANIRYFTAGTAYPKKSKLLLVFDDGSLINVTTSMYSMISVWKRGEAIENTYFAMELTRVGALDDAFTYGYFTGLINDTTLKLSTKAFLATEQRILGIGNGVLQDILFNAKLHPKRKMNTLDESEVKALYDAVVSTLTQMVAGGGRNTEKTIYGVEGGYQTILSSKTYRQQGCPVCKGEIVKEQYLGGSIYYCPKCQVLQPH